MTDTKTYLIMEVVGTSTKSMHDAIQNGITAAHKAGHHVRWFEIIEKRGHVDGDKILYYQVTLKLGYNEGKCNH